MITSAKQTNWLDDVMITDHQVAGLPAPSKIRLKIFSLDFHLIEGRLGHLAAADKESIIIKLDKYL